jgi:hypothetical protein
MRDCNTCAHHVQGRSLDAAPATCHDCLSFGRYHTIAVLPYWQPKEGVATGEVVDTGSEQIDYPVPTLLELDPTHPQEVKELDKWTFAKVNSWTPPASGGTKYDDGKPGMHLLDNIALREIAKVLDFGAKKYAPNNWRKGIAMSRLLAAALRHLFAYASGEKTDPESGLSHLAHAGCCVMFALNMEQTRPDLNDTFQPEKA